MFQRSHAKPGAYEPYAPLDTLKPFGDAVWIVDGPEIRMRYFSVTLPFSTRMTVIRLPSGEIWLHSPIRWTEDLGAAIAALGPVSHLVAPNSFHYWFLPEWQQHFPSARCYGPPGLAGSARRPLHLDEILTDTAPAAWHETIAQCLFGGAMLTEVDFFHRPSRTLILTDIIENFEPDRIRSPLLRWLMRLVGAAHPDGKAPFDLQLSFTGHRPEMRAAARQMLAWSPERIIIAHGRCYESDAVAELERAFRWVL